MCGDTIFGIRAGIKEPPPLSVSSLILLLIPSDVKGLGPAIRYPTSLSLHPSSQIGLCSRSLVVTEV